MSEIYVVVDNSMVQNRKVKRENEIALNKGNKIHFVDKNLNNTIIQFLGKNPNESIYVDDVIDIVELNLSQKNIKNISGLEYFLSLESLSLYNNQIEDLTPLKKLADLKHLHLFENEISD